MAYTAIAGTDTISASRSVINTGIQDAEKNRSGASAPSSPVAGCFWRDTSAGTVPLKMWTGAAWVTLFPDLAATGGGLAALTGATFTGVVAGIAATATAHFPIVSQLEALLQSIVVPIGTLSAAATRYLWRWPHAKTSIVSVHLLNDGAIALNAGAYWTFQVRNVTQSVNLCSAAKDTGTVAAIVADAPYTLGVDQNNGPGTATPPAAGDAIALQITRTGAPTNLGAVGGNFAAVVTYKVGIV